MKKSYVFVAVALVGGVVALAIIGNNAGLTKDSWPGWVQAIGSIAALAVAIFVMNRQNTHAARLVMASDMRALRRRASSVEVLLARGVKQATYCAKVLPSVANIGSADLLNAAKKTMTHIVSEARRVLLIVPAHELGSFEMTSGLQDMIDCLGHLERTIEGWNLSDINELSPNYELVLDKHQLEAENALSLFKQGMESLPEN